MKIAYTMGAGRGDTDLLLFRLSQALIAEGLRPAGAVQINTERCDGAPCDMDLKLLPDGAIIRISQSLGPEARGCRLDPAALEQAVGAIGTALTTGADCLLVNKFGKHEADGRGFRPVIAEALSLDLPVLVGVNRLNAEAFLDFAQGVAVELPPQDGALLDWVRDAYRVTREVARA